MKTRIAHWTVILTVLVIVLLTFPVNGQIRSVGEVVELIDARTVVVAVPAGRVTVELQYIEVPDPTQSLHSVVKDHAKSLLLGKSVELLTQGFTRGKASGKLILNGVDVCQQLIRDGAAWHVPIEISGQVRAEFDSYAESEALARNEKRGIWSVSGLKPAWQVRAELDETRRQNEAAARHGKPTAVGVDAFRTDTRNGPAPGSGSISKRTQMDAWVSVFAHSRKEEYGIQVRNHPSGQYSTVYTSPSLIDFVSPTGKERLECRAIYVTYGGETFYFIGFRAIAEEYRFSKNKTRMTAMVDNQVVAFGTPFGRRGQGMIGFGAVASEEIMLYRTSKAALRRLANAKTVEFRIDKLAGSLPSDGRELFKQLVTSTD